jgi:hypothetical protein
MQSQSVENVFARAWDLLTSNWIIIVPGAVVGLIVGLITALVAPAPVAYDPSDPTQAMARLGAGFVSGLIIGVVAIAGFIVTQCYTAGMAGAAWQRGTTTLQDGAEALRRDAPNVLVAAVGLFVLGIVAAILAPFTLFLSLFLYYLFFMYTIASAVVGNQPGMSALAESFAIARARFGTTLIIGIVLIVLLFLGKLIAIVLGFAPFIGPIVAAIVNQVVVAFATLVIVGEYLTLRGAPPVSTDPVL